MISNLPPIVLGIILGVIGAGSRIALQIWRDKTPTQTPWQYGALLCLGGVGGWLAYAIAGGEMDLIAQVACWGLGFVAPDVVENFANGFSPKPPS